ALGNISFTEAKFDEVWEKKDGKGNLFMVFPSEFYPAQNGLELSEDDMRYVADDTITQLAFMEMDYNLRQAEGDYHKAATMQRVFNSDTEATDDKKIIDVPLRMYYRRK
ncbi:MAG TPA: hypothetical protein PK474_09605, partial [Agitococcus sp.]|nr:hypothetical protein [Agitococcus sp.]